jgi:TRAP-type C4-dicarboxylate transport system permease small subunit
MELEILLFTIVAVALYFGADWALRTVERIHGSPLPHRNLVYFAIILVLTLVSFGFLQRLTP